MPQPYELLEIADEPEVELMIIGCGNVLRGDDALGPILIRRLWDSVQIPRSVRLMDGGTSGMDVAFQMHKARNLVIVDACATGGVPGTVYCAPAQKLENLPQPGTMGSHDFRWDNALAFGKWLLGPHLPGDIDIYLVEVESTEMGEELSAPAQRGAEVVLAHLKERIARVSQ